MMALSAVFTLFVKSVSISSAVMQCDRSALYWWFGSSPGLPEELSFWHSSKGCRGYNNHCPEQPKESTAGNGSKWL